MFESIMGTNLNGLKDLKPGETGDGFFFFFFFKQQSERNDREQRGEILTNKKGLQGTK